jgi:hypothetical protein
VRTPWVSCSRGCTTPGSAARCSGRAGRTPWVGSSGGGCTAGGPLLPPLLGGEGEGGEAAVAAGAAAEWRGDGGWSAPPAAAPPAPAFATTGDRTAHGADDHSLTGHEPAARGPGGAEEQEEGPDGSSLLVHAKARTAL